MIKKHRYGVLVLRTRYSDTIFVMWSKCHLLILLEYKTNFLKVTEFSRTSLCFIRVPQKDIGLHLVKYPILFKLDNAIFT